MPELPEVETTKRGISPYLIDQRVLQVVVRQPQLRWKIPTTLQHLCGYKINAVIRRAKYLFLQSEIGTVILHLGMSGTLRMVTAETKVGPHDHVDFILDNGWILRFRDPRRFGSVLWTEENPYQHKLIKHLAPEPLTDDFTADYFFQISRRRRGNLKVFIMTGKNVVGVGNIYASEALFMAKIHPQRIVGTLTFIECKRLVACIKKVLTHAIQQGGTSLRDFVNEKGEAGYFQLKLQVYGKTNHPCTHCGMPIKQITIGQRNTFYCDHCQI